MKSLLFLIPVLMGAGTLKPPPQRVEPIAPPPARIEIVVHQPKLWLSPMPYPVGSVKYVAAKHTQSIRILDNRHVIEAVPIVELERKWHFSGGLADVGGWRSDKFRFLPRPARTWIGNMKVKNRDGFMQTNRGIQREYADGTRFDDVLSVDGVVFEHRVREKANGKWRARIIYEDAEARPRGYTGLTVSCASCHDQTGTGGYATGLVPGGDTVLSDPLDWEAPSDLVQPQAAAPKPKPAVRPMVVMASPRIRAEDCKT